MTDSGLKAESELRENAGAGLQIEAVLFDYGQVLSKGPNATAWERMRATAGGSAELFYKGYWEPRHDYDRGTLSGTEYWHRVAKTTGHPGLNESELEALYAADIDLWTDRNEPMIAWAQSLQRRGVKTGILSNIGDRMETGIRAKFDWIGHFSHATWSHRLRLAKPEAAIYQHAAEGLGAVPQRILFVDDREDNIEGARRAGMVGVQYSTFEAFVSEIRRLGLQWLLDS